MSVSTRVKFLRKPDDPAHAAKVEAVRALAKAGVTAMPQELAAYFKTKHTADFNPEDMLEVKSVSLEYGKPGELAGVTPFHMEWGVGMEIDLSKLPKDIAIIKVIMS